MLPIKLQHISPKIVAILVDHTIMLLKGLFLSENDFYSSVVFTCDGILVILCGEMRL